MIHYEPIYDSPYIGITNDEDPKYLRPGYMGEWVKTETCPVCGEPFAVYNKEKHCWRIGGRRKEKRRIVCSWHCQRDWEKAEAAKPHKQKGGGRLDWNVSVECALVRKAQCLEKIELYKARQAVTTGQANHKAGQNAARWRSELKEVEEFLRTKGVSA